MDCQVARRDDARPFPWTTVSCSLSSRPRLGGLTSRKGTRTSRFIVPIHGMIGLAAFHEPTHPRPLPREEQAFVRVLPVPLLGGVRGGFMVNTKNRKRAFH